MIYRITKIFFLILIFSLPLVQPFNPQISGLRMTVTDFLFPVVFIFWLISIFLKQSSFKKSKFYYFLGFYFAAMIVSTTFSSDPRQSFLKLLAEFYLLLLAVVTFNLCGNPNFLKKIVIVWLSATFLSFLATIAGVALFYAGYKTPDSNLFLYHFGTLPSGNYPRIQALFTNANMLCNYLNISLMFALLAEKNQWLKKFWARILQTAIWITALFTISPGLGGLFLSLGCWRAAIFQFENKILRSRAFLTVGILAAVVFFASSLISVDTPNTDRDFSLPLTAQKFEPSVRVLVWETSLNIISFHPIVGNGTGMNSAGLSYIVLSGEAQYLSDAHNVWLNITAQLGILGLIFFSCLMIFLFRQCSFALSEPGENAYARLAVSCAFLGAFLYQGLNGSYEDARHLWILFGLAAGNFSSQLKNKVENSAVI